MKIRDYRPGDYPQVEELWKATGIYTVERGDTPEVILRCLRQGGKFLVMENPSIGEVIGTSWLTWDGRRMFLHHFSIHPEYQHQGHGRALAARSLAFASEMGCPVKLEVHRANASALKLYTSMGFEGFGDYEVLMNLNP